MSISHRKSRRQLTIEKRGGIHAVEVQEGRDVSNLMRVIKQEPIRLPEDVEARLYGMSGRNLAWAKRVTEALVRGELPEGITVNDIIKRVRGEKE